MSLCWWCDATGTGPDGVMALGWVGRYSCLGPSAGGVIPLELPLQPQP